MNTFLQELSKKLAERWLALLVLPGVLWVAVAVLANRLGWRHALDPTTALSEVPAWTTGPGSANTGAIVFALGGILVAAAAAGLVAIGLGTLVRRLWTLPGGSWPIRLLVERRHRRWKRANTSVGKLAVRAAQLMANESHKRPTTVQAGPDVAEAITRRDSIGLEPPTRPTWIADRWQACTLRVRRTYGLDLTVAWPRLWSVLPEQLRADINAAQDSYTAASSLIGWGVLHGALFVWWWPALPISLTIIATGWIRGRSATEVLCLLVETAADLHTRDLAHSLGVPHGGPLTFATGDHITTILRKDPSPPT